MQLLGGIFDAPVELVIKKKSPKEKDDDIESIKPGINPRKSRFDPKSKTRLGDGTVVPDDPGEVADCEEILYSQDEFSDVYMRITNEDWHVLYTRWTYQWVVDYRTHYWKENTCSPGVKYDESVTDWREYSASRGIDVTTWGYARPDSGWNWDPKTLKGLGFSVDLRKVKDYLGSRGKSIEQGRTTIPSGEAKEDIKEDDPPPPSGMVATHTKQVLQPGYKDPDGSTTLISNNLRDRMADIIKIDPKRPTPISKELGSYLKSTRPDKWPEDIDSGDWFITAAVPAGAYKVPDARSRTVVYKYYTYRLIVQKGIYPAKGK